MEIRIIVIKDGKETKILLAKGSKAAAVISKMPR